MNIWEELKIFWFKIRHIKSRGFYKGYQYDLIPLGISAFFGILDLVLFVFVIKKGWSLIEKDSLILVAIVIIFVVFSVTGLTFFYGGLRRPVNKGYSVFASKDLC